MPGGRGMSMLPALYVSTLLAVPGINRKTARCALGYSAEPPSSIGEMRDTLLEANARNPWVVVPSEADLADAHERAKQELERAEQLGLEALVAGHEGFPGRLCSIPDAPVILYARGNVASLASDMSIAVAGTREPTRYGVEAAQRLGVALAQKGFTVVSGLATGCDTAAHLGCLEAGGSTVAVLAHGLHMIYPACNRGLADRIVRSGGCLVSEYPPGEEPRRHYFIERDRLQSGLGRAVVIVETDVEGGAMHTARFCVEQGRLLGCLVPPSRSSCDLKWQGNRELLASGKACPLQDVRDVETLVARLGEASVGNAPGVPVTNDDSSYLRRQLSLFDLGKL